MLSYILHMKFFLSLLICSIDFTYVNCNVETVKILRVIIFRWSNLNGEDWFIYWHRHQTNYQKYQGIKTQHIIQPLFSRHNEATNCVILNHNTKKKSHRLGDGISWQKKALLPSPRLFSLNYLFPLLQYGKYP